LRFGAGVLCRIECRREDTQLIVRLSGRLTQAHVPDLLEICAQAPQPTIELDELISVDTVGIDALLRVERQGARLVGLPEYVRLTLDTLAGERGH
jgi:anti-anti-sigma regulatory factor